MVWLISSAVGFIVVTAVVIALARSSTARWEREKRALRAPRGEAGNPAARPAGIAVRLPDPVVRTATAALRLGAPLGRRLEGVAGVLASRKQLLSRVRPSRLMLGVLRTAGAFIRHPRWISHPNGT